MVQRSRKVKGTQEEDFEEVIIDIIIPTRDMSQRRRKINKNKPDTSKKVNQQIITRIKY